MADYDNVAYLEYLFDKIDSLEVPEPYPEEDMDIEVEIAWLEELERRHG